MNASLTVLKSLGRHDAQKRESLTNRNIIATFFEHASDSPDKAALIISKPRFLRDPVETVITYRTIAADTIRTAERLKAKGFRKGDRILVFIPMSYSLYVTILAILYLGAEAVFIDAWADRKRLTDCCKVVKPKGFIGSAMAQMLRFTPEIRRIPIKLVDRQVLSPHHGETPGAVLAYPEIVKDEDTAVITLTTGTTGLPKGAEKSHGLLWNQFAILNNYLKIQKTNIDMTIIPVYVLQSLGLGVTSVLPLVSPTKPTAFSPPMIVRQILHHKVTSILGSPAFFEKLADYVLEKRIVLPVQRIGIGGAPIFRDAAQKLIDAFPSSHLEVVYGCTEVLPISGLPLKDSLRFDPDHGLPVGKKVPEIDVEIIRPHDGPIVLNAGRGLNNCLVPRGEAGEIIVKGPHVLPHYLGTPEISRNNKIVDGAEIWHRTGDAGWMDQEGNIFLLGRIVRRFDACGACRYPIPYEQRLRSISGVTFSAVLEYAGLIHAIVECEKKNDGDNGRLRARMSAILEDIKPDRCLVLGHIPRDPRHNSKIDYEKLIRLLSN